jgi:phosphoglycerate kinase
VTALLSKVDTVLLGGRIAYTFLAAEGAATGDSPVEQEFIPWAKDVLTRHRGHILLPEDHVVARSLDERNEIRIVPRAIPTGFKGLDIGRSASLSFVRELLQGAGTIFSNGPPGGVRNR